MLAELKEPVRKEAKEAVYLPLKQSLKDAIDQGRLAPGDLIPSENVLAEKFAISRSSVRLALSELEQEGMIGKKPGKGSFVRDLVFNSAEPVQAPIRNLGIDVELNPSGNDWYGGMILHGGEEVCDRAGCRVAIFRNRNFDGFKKGFYDGVILSGAQAEEFPMIERLPELGIYPVLVNRITESPNMAYVAINYRRESARAAGALLDRGHRRIGIISAGIADGLVNELRFKGFQDAEESRGIEGVEKLCIVPSHRDDDYYAQSIYDFLRNNQVDAVYLFNGCFALPLFAALHRLGIAPAQAPAIMCFDDIEHLYSMYRYAFTYVKMPLQEMGRDAANYLLNRIAGGKSVPTLKKMYPAELFGCGVKLT